MDTNFRISLVVFFILSILTCVTFKDTFVIALFAGMVVITIVSILVGIKRKQNLSFDIIYISWFIACNLFTLGFKYISNINIFESFKDKIFNLVFMVIPILLFFYIAKSAAKAQAARK